MAVGTSSVSIRDIYNEINSTTHGANVQIGSGVSMSSLRTSSNAYTSGTYSGGTPDVEAAPDRISEWFNYTHAISMGSITYAVRIAAAQASWGLNQEATDDVGPGENGNADGGIVLWRTYDGSNTYIRAKGLSLGQNATTNTRSIYDTSSSALTLANAGQVVITIPVSNVAITVTNQHNFSGSGLSTPVTKAGGTLGGGAGETVPSQTPLISLGATAAETESQPNGEGSDDDEHQAIFRIELQASKSGYITTALNEGVTNGGIVIDCHNSSQADEEEGGGGE